jgi:hypothetical protein
VRLPRLHGGFETLTLRPGAQVPSAAPRPSSRTAFAAAHVVADPLSASSSTAGDLDWEATLAQRHRIWALGLGVAEAMDTAQRGMGIDWTLTQKLIDCSLAEARTVGGSTVVGIATDNVPSDTRDLAEIEAAYLEQLEFVESRGGRVVVMASRQLAASATSPDDYLRVYDAILRAAHQPVILHWLGPTFDPALTGYWGSPAAEQAQQTVLELISSHVERVDGIKISLLDAGFETTFRRHLPQDVRLYTGDDFNYVDLIAGDGARHSDALLGAFSAIAPLARAALARLDAGDEAGYRAILEPTLPLSRLVFGPPTSYYKTGIVWLAYLRGHQDHFRMLGGLESGRSVRHLCEVFREANAIGLFEDVDLAADRFERWLTVQVG